MALRDVLVPALGDSVSEATLSRWFKRPGDVVVEGEAIAEIETDKVTLEVNAPDSGVLSDLLVAVGASVTPGMVLVKMSHAPSTHSEARREPPSAASIFERILGADHRPIYDEAGELTPHAWQAIERAALSKEAKRIAASLDQTYDFVKNTCRAISGRP